MNNTASYLYQPMKATSWSHISQGTFHRFYVLFDCAYLASQCWETSLKMYWQFYSFWVSLEYITKLGQCRYSFKGSKKQVHIVIQRAFQPICWLHYIQTLHPQDSIMKCRAINRMSISATTHQVWLGAKLAGSKPTDAASSHRVRRPHPSLPLPRAAPQQCTSSH